MKTDLNRLVNMFRQLAELCLQDSLQSRRLVERSADKSRLGQYAHLHVYEYASLALMDGQHI